VCSEGDPRLPSSLGVRHPTLPALKVAYLALFFGEQLSLAFLPPSALASFRANGVSYRDTGAGHFVAHYDRLLADSGELAGIQLWANPEEAGLGRLLDRLPSREYLEPLGSTPIYRSAPMGFGS